MDGRSMVLGTHLALPAIPTVVCHVPAPDQWFSNRWLFLTIGIRVQAISKDPDLELMIREWFQINIPVLLLIPISVHREPHISSIPIYRWITIIEQVTFMYYIALFTVDAITT